MNRFPVYWKAVLFLFRVTSKMLRISSVWRIRQIDFLEKTFIHASMTHAFSKNLHDSEQFQKSA